MQFSSFSQFTSFACHVRAMTNDVAPLHRLACRTEGKPALSGRKASPQKG
jgi:hypothetical protein